MSLLTGTATLMLWFFAFVGTTHAMAFTVLDYNNYLSSGNISGPMGPSSPGFVQGSANTIPSAARPGGGSVLGTNTSALRAAAPMGQQAVPQQQQQQPQQQGPNPYDMQRQQIDNTYNAVFEGLDRQAGLLPGQRTEFEGQVNTSANLQQQGIQSQTAATSAKLGTAREDVRARQATGVRDLASNMRNMLQAGNNYLGTRGAGDSSAAGLYNYALGKESTRARSDLMSQASSQIKDIDMKEVDIKTLADQETNNLNMWKNDQLGKVSQWFNQQVMGIEQQRGQARQAKEQAKLEVLQNAQGYLQQLDQQATQYGTQLQQWATDRLSQINNVKMQMGQMANVNPQALVQQELQGMNMTGGQQGGDFGYMNPYLQKRNEEQKRIFGGGK